MVFTLKDQRQNPSTKMKPNLLTLLINSGNILHMQFKYEWVWCLSVSGRNIIEIGIGGVMYNGTLIYGTYCNVETPIFSKIF